MRGSRVIAIVALVAVVAAITLAIALKRQKDALRARARQHIIGPIPATR
jgi:hypothetical protein